MTGPSKEQQNKQQPATVPQAPPSLLTQVLSGLTIVKALHWLKATSLVALVCAVAFAIQPVLPRLLNLADRIVDQADELHVKGNGSGFEMDYKAKPRVTPPERPQTTGNRGP